MNIDDLKYFAVAAETLNFSRASKQLGVTQSALSHSVARLESELGHKLFRKEGRRMLLTPHGKGLAERSALIVSQVARLKKDLMAETAPLLGSCRVGATHGEVLRIASRACAKLPLSQEGLIQILSLRSGDIITQLADGLLDLGVCLNPQPHPKLVITEIATIDIVPVVRAGHPILALKPARRLMALREYPFALSRPLPGVAPCSTHPIFKTIGEDLAPSYYFDAFDTAREIILSSDTWALLPDEGRSSQTVSLGEKRYAKKISVALVTPTNDTVAGSLKTLLTCLRQECEQRGWRMGP